MSKLEKNWLEWIIFAVGLILVVSTLGYLIYDATTVSEAPPNIEVKIGETQPQGQNFLVPVIATNKGEQTAETVQIEVILENNGKEEESAEMEIQFLPRGAKRSGWVTFEKDPRTVEKIKTRAVGFEKP
ncbi:hypothetical protein ACE1B6_08080 [Aerosakkonemataceae cyanobacterium BLCC-F154]|uniref:TIGR02588 family protein n=1 Tax=Floridaenema fluviatile BLCC-F154 TaxID=3153640 RepID=A0ABV4Y960_9CYAN